MIVESKMSAILAYGMYGMVRGVEKISMKLGIGEFIGSFEYLPYCAFHPNKRLI